MNQIDPWHSFSLSAWKGICRIYAIPGVPEAMLRLQADHDLDVLLLLFLVLCEEEGLCLPASCAAEAEQAVAHWRAQVVLPLRAVRSWQKAQEARPAVARHRAEVKKLELDAERIELELLCDWGQAWQGQGLGQEQARGASVGRGPDDPGAALAYLLSRGLSETDAISCLKRLRTAG